MGIPWTPEDDARIMELRSQGMTFADIAFELGRKAGSTAGRYRRLVAGEDELGRARQFNPWTPEEDALLTKLWDKQPLLDIAKAVGRSRSACFHRAAFLGIKAPQKPEHAGRRCHDCGRPTSDYRCPACRAKWKRKWNVQPNADEEEGI